jgi:hypothetical protein
VNQDDFKVFARSWRAAVKSIQPNAMADADSIALTFRSLEAYPLPEVLHALSQHMLDPDRGQYIPKPADIVRQIDMSTETRAALAWDRVRTAAIRVGQYTNVVFDDQAIHAVVDGMGGWARICEMETAQVPQYERQFVQRYRHYAAHPPERYVGVLGGIACGREVAYIGDRAACEAVAAGGCSQVAAIERGSTRALAQVLDQKSKPKPEAINAAAT